jgi:hypothetical protein
MQKSASHPFRVGEIYASRVGEYEVMAITPPTMTIRYHDDNRLVVTDIAISARIWENLQLPPEAPEPAQRTRATGKPVTGKPATPHAPRHRPTSRG